MPDWKGIVRERLTELRVEGGSESEIFDELAQHLEDRYAELLASGLSAQEAQQAAMEPLRDGASVAEALQKARRRRAPEPPEPAAGWFSSALYDLRMARRNMLRQPGFTLMVAGMLALGIAGNAAIFSVFNGLFLKALPFPDSARLIDLDETAPAWNLHYVGISEPDSFVWREHNTTFDGIAYFSNPSFTLIKTDHPQHIRGAKVTREFLDVLGLKLVLGRNFLPEEDRPKGSHAALLGYGLWQRVFHGDRKALGQSIWLDGEAYQVVGVLPQEALFPDRAEVWVPLAAHRDPAQGNGWYLHGIGRLKRGVTPEQATADLLRAHRAQIAAGQTVNGTTSPILTSLRERYLGDYQSTSKILLIAVSVVLLIACVNIAALMLVRASARSNEMAIRTAIGGSRGRIVRQLLAENAMLAAAGGIAGLLLGAAGLRLIVASLPDSVPRWISFGLDTRFAVFCVGITAAAALLFGLIPSLQASRADVRSCLHEAALRASPSRARRRALDAMMAIEISMALALLICSGLLLRAFHKVTHADPGFKPDNVLTFRVDLPEARYAKADQAVAFYRNLLEQLRGAPGVAAAGAASAPPLGGHWGNFFTAETDPPLGPKDKDPVVLQVAVTPGYFDAIGMTLLHGRKFDDHDGDASHSVAIVNETFARLHWPTASALGKRIRAGSRSPWMDVVGVMHNEKHYGLDGEDRPAVYLPHRSFGFPVGLTIVLRAYSNPEALTATARRVLEGMDNDLAMYAVQTMTEQIDTALWPRRAYSWLFGSFALIALILAAAGVYGVISYAVAQRTQEVGIRMALGASPGAVLASVLRSGMSLVAIGAAIGLAAALAGAGLLNEMLYGVSPRDPLVYVTAAAAIVAVGLLANAIPARRAASLDPMRALRNS